MTNLWVSVQLDDKWPWREEFFEDEIYYVQIVEYDALYHNIFSAKLGEKASFDP